MRFLVVVTVAFLMWACVSSERAEIMSKDPFRPGQILQASDLNKIMSSLKRRITGGKGIQVRAFGDRLVISMDAKPSKPAAAVCPIRILAVTPTALYADTTSGKLFIGINVPGGPTKVYRYSGSGNVNTAEFKTLLGETVHDFIRDPVSGNMYACTGDTKGRIFVSTDDGDSWTLCKTTAGGNPNIDHAYPLVSFTYVKAIVPGVRCIDHSPTAPVKSSLYSLQPSGYWALTLTNYSMEALAISSVSDVSTIIHVAGDEKFRWYNVWTNTSGTIANPGYDVMRYASSKNFFDQKSSGRVLVLYTTGTGTAFAFQPDEEGPSEARFTHSDTYIYTAVSDDAAKTVVYRSETGLSSSWERVGEDCDAWGGESADLKTAEYFDGRMYVGSDGLWQGLEGW